MSHQDSRDCARPDPCQHQSTGSGQIPERLPTPPLCSERGSDWDAGNCCTQSCSPNLVRADDNTRTLPLPLAINWGTFYPSEVLALVTTAPLGESIPLLKPSHFSLLSVSLSCALTDPRERASGRIFQPFLHPGFSAPMASFSSESSGCRSYIRAQLHHHGSAAKITAGGTRLAGRSFRSQCLW